MPTPGMGRWAAVFAWSLGSAQPPRAHACVTRPWDGGVCEVCQLDGAGPLVFDPELSGAGARCARTWPWLLAGES